MIYTTCRHCGRGKVNRPRGLCWTCYHTPGVRDVYPSEHKCACRGYGHTIGGGFGLPEPTDALPGTASKVAVLRQRAKAGVSLFHPLDAKRKVKS